MSVKKPWERRLKDLSQLLHNCAATYFKPDLFRINTNQFLQTSRTVTFIIQKHKSNIPDYESWYKSNVLNRWKDDDVMQWAKNSRNTIEKEGDLELFSTLSTTLIFSYLEEQDIKIECGRNELLGYGIKKLVRLAQKILPSGVSDAAVIKIERKWITTSLPSWELLHALSYVYARVYECCQLLGRHLECQIDKCIPDTSNVDLLREQARKIQYVKFRGMETHHMTSEIVDFDHEFKPHKNVKKILNEVRENPSPPKTLTETIHIYSKMAEMTFHDFGNHAPMLFMFNDRWQILDVVTTEFEDQATKFIFWRMIGEHVASLKTHGLVWVSEAWIRDMKNYIKLPIRNMPIIGERLQVLGIDKDNNRESVVWRTSFVKTIMKCLL